MSILARIHAHGGDARMEGYQLRISRGRLTNANLAWLRDRKDALRAEIWPLYDAWSERAAINEYCAGMSRDDAEAAAYEEVSA